MNEYTVFQQLRQITDNNKMNKEKDDQVFCKKLVVGCIVVQIYYNFLKQPTLHPKK